jgi:hypothetical protein
MAFSKAFERELNGLFQQRTRWLRSELGVDISILCPLFQH